MNEKQNIRKALQNIYTIDENVKKVFPTNNILKIEKNCHIE